MKKNVKNKTKIKTKIKTKTKPQSQSRPQFQSKPKKIDRRAGFKIPAAIGKMNIKQLTAMICSYLTSLGYDPVLTGRGCASIYGGADVKTDSIEFVISEYVVEDVEGAMSKLGFSRKVHRTFAKKNCKFEVTFLPPPLSAGDNIVEDTSSIKVGGVELKLLNPTDCVRHRLAAYYRFGNSSALEDAIAVARKHDIDIGFVERWSRWEWASDKYEDFAKRLKETS